MKSDLDEQLAVMIVALKEWHSILQSHNYTDGACVLAIARLELQTKLNQVSSEELKMLCDAIVDQKQSSSEACARLRQHPVGRQLLQSQNEKIMRSVHSAQNKRADRRRR